jgi:hypothetical protein
MHMSNHEDRFSNYEGPSQGVDLGQLPCFSSAIIKTLRVIILSPAGKRYADYEQGKSGDPNSENFSSNRGRH